jgi:hypothetical protein
MADAGDDLWPKGGPGGRSAAAHVEAHHLRNLLIGYLGSEQIAGAADAVRLYSSLQLWPGSVGSPAEWRTRPEFVEMFSSAMRPDLTLGESIDTLIRVCLDRHAKDTFCQKIRRLTIYHHLTEASLTVGGINQTTEFEVSFRNLHKTGPESRRPKVLHGSTRFIEAGIFLILAEMLER